MTVEELAKPCWFLVPIKQDSRSEFGNGQLHEAQKFVDLLKRLQDLAGGATRGLSRSEVRGIWAEILESSIRFEIGLKEEKVDEFLSVLQIIARDFGQECIYAVISGNRAVLVYQKGGKNEY